MDPDIGLTESLEQITLVYNLLVEFFVNYSFKLVGALIVLIIGLIIANRVCKLCEKLFLAKNFDVTLSRFLANLIKVLIIAMVAMVVLSQLNISITPMVAAIGALSLGAGLAVQGLLTNYSAGLNIVITRPYVVGDTIRLLGVTGVVKEVRLAATILTNEDEEVITIPNRHVIGEIIHNSKEARVLELEMGVAYASDIDQVAAIIKSAVAEVTGNDKREAQVGVDRFDDSAIVFAIRCWVPTEEYFHQRYVTNQAIFKALIANQIQIPFPQREITLLNAPPEDTPSDA